jgi:hypothetical protein
MTARSQMTREETRAWARMVRRETGLPASVTDPVVVARVREILAIENLAVLPPLREAA